MTNRLRLLCLSAWLFLLTSASFQIQAQVFTGAKLTYQSPTLQSSFYAYEVFRINAEPLANFVRTAGTPSTLVVGDHVWSMELTNSNLLSSDYFTKVQSPQGDIISHKRPEIAFKGWEASGGKVRLTLDKDFIYGFIEQNNKVWRIEPLRYLEPGAAEDLYVLYEKSNVVPDPSVHCGVTEETEKGDLLIQEKHESSNSAEFLAVYELEIAIASDQLMVAKYGGNAGVESHNIAVLNDVEGDYTGNFNHDLCIHIVTQYFATSFPGPWSNSNDAGTLLGSFANWGNGGGFGVNFDVGELWTDRDFNGGTIGLAYLNGICNNNKYHCLQDFSTNSEFLRCMTSHELGHNFSSVHDNCSGGEFIMCPFVSAATAWSSQSANAINAYMQNKINSGCLTTCSQGPPLVSQFDFNPNPGCVGQPVQFTDQSTGVISTWSWVFAGGTPPTSSLQNPVVIFNSPGSHNVALVVTGPSGNNATSNQNIDIGPLPVPNFTYTVDDLTLTFTNTSANATSYLWEFGDGGESTEVDPVYTYGEAGTYVVKLTATNYCGSISKTYTINTFPTPNFSAEPSDGCASLLVQMVNESSANATSFQWQFPGGSPAASNQVNPVVLYGTPGTYTITLTAYNNAGSNTITRTNYIVVTTVPAPGFTSTVNGLTATFTNTSANATSFLWNFGDGGTSTLTNPTHTYAVGGNYTVTLTATNLCGSVVVTKTVSVAPPPVASFTPSSNSGCAPLTVTFNNTSTGATSYSWVFPGGNPATSTDASPTVEFAAPGVYTVVLTAANASGTSTATTTITVNTVPTAGFTSSNNGAVVSFTNSSANATSYSWNFGDGGSSTEANPTHTYGADGVYTVILTATNDCGTVTFTQTVTIVTPPVANFSATPTSGCGPLTVQFTNSSSANATSFSWTFAGGEPATSTAANPVVVYNTPGTYTVVLVATNSAGSNTVTQTNYITVDPTPTAGFSSTTSGAVATFTNSSINATSYSWDFGDSGTSTDVNPEHTYASDGVYTVVLTATNACGSVTTTQTVTIVTPPIAGFNTATTNGCAPFTVQFNNTSSSNATTFAWVFDGGTPATSTDQNPVVVYNAPGVYSVTLTASNSAGTSTATQTDYITVGTTPNAGFSATVAGATATFTNSSVNATSYSWTFGDGGTSTEVNPVHTYTGDGTYTVVLTATNACGSVTFTQNVVIITDNQAGFTANITSGCGPLTVQFQDLSSENTIGWTWTFPGGDPATSTDQNPVVVYNIPGSYDVTLVATGVSGNSVFTQTNFITVFGPPSGSFSSTLNQNTATFTNNSTGGTSYLWNFGDGGSSIEANPTHTYANDGLYTVVLAVTNNCGTTLVQQTIEIVTVPVAAFTFNSSMGCAPLAVLFNNTSSSNATSFNWVFEGGEPATSTDANPVVLWNTPGVYLVTLTASNSAGGSTATASITVNTTPIASFTTQTAGLTMVTTNTTINGDSYQWDFGDGGTSTEANPTHTYATTDTFTVVLIATNGCGSTTFVQQVVIAGTAPIPSFTTNLTTGCAGMVVQFTDASAGNPTGWNWTFPGGTPGSSTDQNPSVTYTTPGTYDVTLSVSNAFGTSTATTTGYITVIQLPTVGFTFISSNGTVNFTNTTVGGDSYSWNFGDGSTSTEQNPSHTYTTAGTFTVSLTVNNACGASTLQQNVTVTLVDTKEVSWLDQFKLFPNPNMGYFTVKMNGLPQSAVEFALFNSLGQVMHTEIVDFSAGTLTKLFEFGSLPSGVYSLRVQAEGAAKYVKVVVQK